MPDHTIFTRISRLAGGSIFTSSVFHGSFSPVHTAARVVDIVNPSRLSCEPARALSIAPRGTVDNLATGTAGPCGRAARR
jgi:hypothetical protein